MRTGTSTVKTRGGSMKSVLAFGDSITYGWSSADLGGYRSQLFALALADGKRFRYVGSQSAGPTTVSGQPFNPLHEGWSAHTILDTPAPTSGIYPQVPLPVYGTFPDIVLLMIGINDVWLYPAGNATIQTRLGTLLDAMVAASPRSLIVIAQNTTQTLLGAQPEFDAYTAAIPGIVATRAALGQRMRSVDMRSLLPTDLLDGIHPNDSGFLKMAQIWYPAIRDLL